MISKFVHSRYRTKSTAARLAAARSSARRLAATLALISGLASGSAVWAQSFPDNPLRGQFAPEVPSWENQRRDRLAEPELTAPQNAPRTALRNPPATAQDYPVSRAAYQSAGGSTSGNSVLKKSTSQPGAPPTGRSGAGSSAAPGTSAARNVPPPPPMPPSGSSPKSIATRSRSTPSSSAINTAPPEAFRGSGPPIGKEWVVGQPVWTDEEGRVIDGGGSFAHESEPPMHGYDVPMNEHYVHHGRAPLRGRLYASGEVLALWTKGMDVPILATSSPATTPINEMGILGQAGTTILFGNQGLNNEGRTAGRVGLGMWLNPGCGTRIESSYLFANEMTTSFTAISPETAVIARPFLNSTTGLQDANLLAVPNQLTGSFTMLATTNFNSVDVVYRAPLAGSCDSFVDFTAGYRHAGLDDNLRIDDSITALVGFPTSSPVIAAGTTISSTDRFETSNQFDGGQIGFACEMVRQRWSYELLLNLALGNTQSSATVNGITTTRLASGATSTVDGGVLALPSNSGTFTTNNFSTISELGLRMNYDFAPTWRFSVVYTLNHWSQVARAGSLVNTIIDPNQIPTAGGGASSALPEFQFNFTDFWAQGIGLRLEHQF